MTNTLAYFDQEKIGKKVLLSLVPEERRNSVQMVTPTIKGKNIFSCYWHSSGLYYKTITIVIMVIVSDATIWSVTYDRN